MLKTVVVAASENDPEVKYSILELKGETTAHFFFRAIS